MDIRKKLEKSLGETKFVHPKDKTQDGFLAVIGRVSAASDTVELIVILPGEYSGGKNRERLEIWTVDNIENIVKTD
ncbi:MAG: hypothetical protein AVO34_02235 [Firmicutes bacterium ML8_F2]|jgi:hypothetical protein|nr:MAG: hypothetical protein AVO34_02235 [Firmicutes bacterium ML8_F2]